MIFSQDTMSISTFYVIIIFSIGLIMSTSTSEDRVDQADSPFLRPFNASDTKEVETQFPPFVKVYKNGTVERYFGSPIVPPSLDDPTTGVATKDVTISDNISARIYIPAAELTAATKKLPVLVYFHGGAFCMESAFSLLDGRYLKQIVLKSGTIIISVEYRLAPEHYLPAAYDDGWAALQWVASHVHPDKVGNFGAKDAWLLSHGDFQKLYLGSDSAGGNLAYNAAMRAGMEELPGGVKLSGVFLACPTMGDSEKKKGSDDVSSTYTMWNFVYPLAPGGINNPLINPFSDDPNAPDMAAIGCRKVLVVTAEKDELREINLRYAAALRRSGWGGKVKVVDVKGENHSFHAFEPFGEKAQMVIRKLAAFIKA